MNSRGSQQWRNSTIRSVYKLAPKPTLSSITIYISLLFTFSIILFFFSTRQIPDNDDPELSIPDDPQPQLPGQELWEVHNSGYHSCIDPTPTYKEAQQSNRYITVRSNGGLNQMRTGVEASRSNRPCEREPIIQDDRRDPAGKEITGSCDLGDHSSGRGLNLGVNEAAQANN